MGGGGSLAGIGDKFIDEYQEKYVGRSIKLTVRLWSEVSASSQILVLTS